MALAPLATTADLVARGVTVSVDEAPIVATYLAVASSIVRDAAACPISQTTSAVTLEARGSRVHLPGQPVTAVSALLVDGVAVTDYRLVAGALTRPCGFRVGSVLDVTYTHGLPTVPADVVDLVCRLVGQELVAFRNGETGTRAVTSERIGDYAVTYSDAETGTMALSKSQRNRLAARFGAGAGVSVWAR